MYNGVNIVLATMHKKENAIQKPFESAFSAKIFVPDNYDTDAFGTFTGEIPRQGTAFETAVSKAKQACEKYGYQYGIASEGSFGPHPLIFYLPADTEWLVFVDLSRDIIIIESEVSTETNYAYLDLQKSDNYQQFLTKTKFGSHGLVLKSVPCGNVLAKGIVELSELSDLLARYFKDFQTLRLETDMRAMMNPTRMQIIHQLTHKLITRIKSICPVCDAPGFGKKSAVGNLPCSDCGTPTQLYEKIQYACIKCDYSERYHRDDRLLSADPMHCSLCNP